MRLFQKKGMVNVYRCSTIFLSISMVLTVEAEELSFPPTTISTQRLNDSQQIAGYSEDLINPESHLAGPVDIATAVKSAVNWHPAITQQVSKLQEQVQKVDVAKAKYYPQVNAGMNNGYSNTYSDSGYSPFISGFCFANAVRLWQSLQLGQSGGCRCCPTAGDGHA